MADDEVKVGTEVLEPAEQNNHTCSSGSMNNAEIEEDKKVNFTRAAKQNPVAGTGKRKSLKSESFEGTPLQITRKGSELGKNLDDGIKKSPVQIKKTRRVGNEINNLRKVKSDSGYKVFNERKCELRKMKSEPRKSLEDPNDENFKNQLQLVKAKTLPPRKIVFDEDVNKSGDDSDKDLGGHVGKIEESSNSRSGEECEELKAVVSNEDQIESIKKKDLEIKDISISVEDQKLKKVVIKEKKERSAPISPVIKKKIPTANHVNIHPKTVSDNSHGTPSKVRSLADLIMWKDVSRSTFVFGIGSFAIISSSYTKDLNISLISVLSYMGLVYLGVSFISKSIIRRESMNMDKINQEYVVGEEEAIWLVKLFLPYVNEFLVKLRGLFSGDPPTTMKLAVLLFIVARCGGSITIWKMTKLEQVCTFDFIRIFVTGFFGVFMVPKLCSCYSSQLAAYGSFWIRRFGDAWESCTHKKAVGLGILTLVWNQSSVVARIWGLFLLFVAFKYYHQYYSSIKHQQPTTSHKSIIKI